MGIQNRRGLLRQVFAGLMTYPLAGGTRACAKNWPNILFVLADDLGWRDTTPHGAEFYETPNVDRLAKRGMLFTQAYAANPSCSPTRASILTGQFPARMGFTAPWGHSLVEALEPSRPPKAPPHRKCIEPRSVTRLSNDYHNVHFEFIELIDKNGKVVRRWDGVI